MLIAISRTALDCTETVGALLHVEAKDLAKCTATFGGDRDRPNAVPGADGRSGRETTREAHQLLQIEPVFEGPPVEIRGVLKRLSPA
jgi:hypothetical protein